MKGRSRIVGLMLLLLPATLFAAPTDCAVSSISSLNFGNYNPFSVSPLDSAATVQITCETTKNSDTVFITGTLSTGSSGSYANRRLLGPAGNNLNYNVYGDPARTAVFGNGSAGTTTLQFSMFLFKNTPRTVTTDLFGRIFAGQDPTVGSYTDTLMYTVNF